MKLFLAALTISGFSVFGISCGSAGVQEPATAQTAAKSESTPTTPTPSRETVTLTSEHPTGSFPLPPDILQDLAVGSGGIGNKGSEPQREIRERLRLPFAARGERRVAKS